MKVEVRQARKEDIGLSFAVGEDAVRQHVEATWGIWDPAEQWLRHAQSFDPSSHWIVFADGEPVGIVAAELEQSHVHLSKLYLRTQARGRGTGSLILSALLQSAAGRSQPLRLSVLAVNERAQVFYARHGFRESSRTAERVFLEARPNPSIERTLMSNVGPHVHSSMSIEPVDPQGPVALSLLREAAVEARALYPASSTSDTPWPGNSPTPPRGVYLVAFAGEAPVACGALRPMDEQIVEVRRMFVVVGARRQGYARAVLSVLERYAVEYGFTNMLLETGSLQSAAMALYESFGFKRIAPFGKHANDPTSVCYEKRIASSR